MRTAAEIGGLLGELDRTVADDLEAQDLDFKEWNTRSMDDAVRLVVEMAVCMANGGGGTVVFGVDDREVGREKAIIAGTLTGVHSPRCPPVPSPEFILAVAPSVPSRGALTRGALTGVHSRVPSPGPSHLVWKPAGRFPDRSGPVTAQPSGRLFAPWAKGLTSRWRSVAWDVLPLLP